MSQQDRNTQLDYAVGETAEQLERLFETQTTMLIGLISRPAVRDGVGESFEIEFKATIKTRLGERVVTWGGSCYVEELKDV